ncbi:MAG TPA: thiamine pyrophosphate-dependent enzyme, partial [Thermoanaerobaculia bacterium]|nr:thiamine pyrophosphate-dependent enzyme [Thermoanaerobaculia bacterium]
RQIRETGKPYCIEAVTYRFSGHGAADILQPYRSKDEVEEHRHRDPIGILRNRLGEICNLTDDEVKKMEEWASEEVAAAVQFAEESAPPDAEELWRDVVAEDAPTPENE